MTSSSDEIEVYYPLIAEKVEYADDYSQVTFQINPARDLSGWKPIRPGRKILLRQILGRGVPQFKRYYSFVTSIEVLDAHRVRFNLKETNQGTNGLTVWPADIAEHYWSESQFWRTDQRGSAGRSGSTIKDFKLGQYIIYENLANYWAGNYRTASARNVRYRRYDYYRDEVVAFETFKAGEFDFWGTRSQNWATA